MQKPPSQVGDSEGSIERTTLPLLPHGSQQFQQRTTYSFKERWLFERPWPLLPCTCLQTHVGGGEGERQSPPALPESLSPPRRQTRRRLEGGHSGNPVRFQGAVTWDSDCSRERAGLPHPPQPEKARGKAGGVRPAAEPGGSLAEPPHPEATARLHLCSQGAGPPPGVRRRRTRRAEASVGA